jgi:hypothetical protein
VAGTMAALSQSPIGGNLCANEADGGLVDSISRSLCLLNVARWRLFDGSRWLSLGLQGKSGSVVRDCALLSLGLSRRGRTRVGWSGGRRVGVGRGELASEGCSAGGKAWRREGRG